VAGFGNLVAQSPRMVRRVEAAPHVPGSDDAPGCVWVARLCVMDCHACVYIELRIWIVSVFRATATRSLFQATDLVIHGGWR